MVRHYRIFLQNLIHLRYVGLRAWQRGGAPGYPSRVERNSLQQERPRFRRPSTLPGPHLSMMREITVF